MSLLQSTILSAPLCLCSNGFAIFRLAQSVVIRNKVLRFSDQPITCDHRITRSFSCPTPSFFIFILQTNTLPQFDASVTLAWPLGDAWVALAGPKGDPIPSRQKVATHKWKSPASSRGVKIKKPQNQKPKSKDLNSLWSAAALGCDIASSKALFLFCSLL
jgi:hypothetical protein